MGTDSLPGVFEGRGQHHVTVDPDDVIVRNQAYDAKTGITDIEVKDGKTVHIIFEAKRGWLLPGADQLNIKIAY